MPQSYFGLFSGCFAGRDIFSVFRFRMMKMTHIQTLTRLAYSDGGIRLVLKEWNVIVRRKKSFRKALASKCCMTDSILFFT
jgi:hypothetical protein